MDLGKIEPDHPSDPSYRMITDRKNVSRSCDINVLVMFN